MNTPDMRRSEKETAMEQRGPRSERGVAGVIVLVLVVWLIIGAFAAGQRHYYSGSKTNCAKATTITVTILAGPLNYAGANPKIKACHVPQPSK
jgi:hypothetical protein